jgi:hypothetical protein
MIFRRIKRLYIAQTDIFILTRRRFAPAYQYPMRISRYGMAMRREGRL